MNMIRKIGCSLLVMLMMAQLSGIKVQAKEASAVNLRAGDTVTVEVSGDYSDLEVTDGSIAIAEPVGPVSYDTKTNNALANGLASDNLYTFELNDDGRTYTVSAMANGTTVYLNIIGVPTHITEGNAPQTTVPASIAITGGAEDPEKFILKDVADNTNLYFNGWENFNGASRGGVSDIIEMSLYKKADGKGSEEIPGFEKVTSIENGGQYLIVAERDNTRYLLHPSTVNMGNSRNQHVAKVTNETVTLSRISVTGVSAGSTTIVSGDKTLTVKVYPESEIFVTNGNKVLRKLSVSEGLSYTLKLSAGLENVTDVVWLADTDLITLSATDKTATLTANNIGTEQIIETEVTVSFIVNGETETHSLPVTIYPVIEETGGTFSFYIAKAENTTPYFSISCDKLIEAVEGEVIYMFREKENGLEPSVDFFGKPEDGYALSYMHDTGSQGNYNKIDSSDPTQCEFYLASGTAGYNQRQRYGDPIVKSMVQDAIDKGCIGGMGYTLGLNGNSVNEVEFASDKLPTLNAYPYAIKKADGTIAPYDNGDYAHVGETVVFKIDVTNYVSENGINYQSSANGGLSTLLDGAFFTNETATENLGNKIGISEDLNSDNNQGGVHTYYVAYTIGERDFGKNIINTVKLNELFNTRYNTSNINAAAQAEANIKIVANTIPPLTDDEKIEPVTPAEPIELPDGTSITQPIQIHQIYYVKKGEEAVLKEFAGENDVDCVGRVYSVSTNNINVTEQFSRADNDSHAMLFTADDTETRDYVVAYYANDDQSSDAWKVYAIKIVPLEDKVAGTNLTIGSKISINYFVNFATQSDASEHAIRNYSSTGSLPSGVDISNLPVEDKPDNYIMKFSDGSIAEYKNKTAKNGSQICYGYSFENVNAYEMGSNVRGVLIDSQGKELCSKDYSVLKYSESMLNKATTSSELKAMLQDMLTYGAYAEQYAVERGWIETTDPNMQKYATGLDGVVPEDDKYHKGSGSVSFGAVNLEMEEGMKLTMNIYFTQEEEGALIWKAGDGINASYGELIKDNNGNITIPADRFGSRTVGESLYRSVSIKGLPPFYWSNGYQFYGENELPEAGLTYSVNTYCMKNRTSSDQYLADLVKAMYKYGQTAESWYKAQTAK